MPRFIRPFLVSVILVAGLFYTALLLTPVLSLKNSAGDSVVLLGSQGEILHLGLSHDERYRFWIPLKDMAPELIAATLRKEDRYHYYHPGVNPLSMLRSFLGCSVRIGSCTGASTITMQLARLRFGLYTRSLFGKARQIWKALVLEHYYSKDELLEAYLNFAPYGSNIEGVGAASIVYFSKLPAQLTASESAVLAVIPQRPTARTLFRAAGIAEARAQAEKLATQQGPNNSVAFDGVQSSARREIRRRVPHLLFRLSNNSESGTKHSTIDSTLQTRVEEQVQRYVERNRRLGINNASVLVVEHSTMKVRAYLGSADYRAAGIQGAVDGVRARRSPGSALKPFLYAAALDRGLIHPESVLKDTELSISNYNPENYERDFLGPISATRALVLSRNIPAVALSEQLRDDGLYELLQAAGIKKLRDKNHYGLALTLGGVEVSLEELAELYAMLASSGVLRPLKFLEPGEQPVVSKRLLSAEASYLVLDMLTDNPRPDGRPGKFKIPWKTGTSFGFRDAWAIGIVGPYVIAVWVGNFDGSSNPAFIGREAAGPLLFSIADAVATAGTTGFDQRIRPAKIRSIEVCAVSGELPGPNCQKHKVTSFIPGISPIESCHVHRAIEINRASGLQVCPGVLFNPATMERKIFEIWPSDILKLFREAGLPRREAPKYESNCLQQHGTGIHQDSRPPVIVSPQNSLAYLVYDEDHRDVPLRAVAEGDQELFWFIDDKFLSKGRATETITWRAEPGEFVIRVVDSGGRSAAVRVRVEVKR